MIALLKHVQDTISDIPETISEGEYNLVKNNMDDYDDWYVGLVGFCACYNGKFFDSYANNVKTKIGTIRNYTDEAIRNIKKQSVNLKNISFDCCDFNDINDNIKNFVIYADIPYKNTYSYNNDFDYDLFYRWCEKMSANNIVLCSEYEMPDDFKCIWQKELTCTLNKNSRSNRIEKLFVYNGGNE